MRTSNSPARLGLAAILLLHLGLVGCQLGTLSGGTGPGFDLPPTIVMSSDVDRGVAPLTVHFNSSGSTDNGIIISRLWDFADGSFSQDIAPTHIFKTTGDFTVRLTLTDDAGLPSTRTLLIQVTERPVATFTQTYNGVETNVAPNAPALFAFDASASYAPDAKPGDKLLYTWDFGDGSREVISVVNHVFATPGTYRVVLTVTNAVGVAGTVENVIEVGIPQPDIQIRTPPADLSNIVVSRSSPLWVYVVYSVEPGVPHFLQAGLDIDRDPTNGNDIPLDTDATNNNNPNGIDQDLNLTRPTALDLRGMTADQIGAFGRFYNLWVEVNTDRPAAFRRRYFREDQAGAPINVIPDFTAAITQQTPSVFLRQTLDAAVVMPQTPGRQIFDLGELRTGDRLFLSLLEVPGYSETFSQPGYSVLILDAQQRLFAWYEDGRVLFTRESKIVIGHFSPNYYVVVDGPGTPNNIPSVKVSVQPQAFADSQPRRQTVLLKFDGGTDITVADSRPFTVPALNIPGFDTQLLENAIITRVRDLYQPYAFNILTSAPADPAVPYQTIYFDAVGALRLNGGKTANKFYGLPNFVDPRNETLTGLAVVDVSQIRNDFPGLVNEQSLGIAIANATAHQIGLLSGLQETTQNLSDIMTNDDTRLPFNTLGFTVANLAPSGNHAPLGIQDAPLLLVELFRK